MTGTMMTEPASPRGLLQAQPWFSEPEVRRLIDTLQASGITARFVGGCVRDALLGRASDDVDLAVDAAPEGVVRALDDAGIKSVPTGIDHGTVTAVLTSRTVEVTSLRCDVETDGRRAVVRFTQDWRADSLRRDFTMNALYADRHGDLSDYHGGLDDLRNGRLRFIGAPAERIREDYLRILRFFRFHAQLGLSSHDVDGLAACRRFRDRLRDLSAERVAKELLRLLEAAAPAETMTGLIEGGFLDYWLPEAGAVPALSEMCRLEPRPDAVRRLAVLCPVGSDGMAAVADRLKLSGRQRDRLAAMAAAMEPPGDPAAARRWVYRLGTELARDRALLNRARDGDRRWDNLIRAASDWIPPEFPLSGRDALGVGMAPGPAIGETLRRIEEDWVLGDFMEDRAALLERLKERGGASR
ncbi:MAG: CCA tRNA nucleotidyltransferase [Alphaproteobacteria bacterium]|nr:CCA tRNA nucleotidyltransferase [Alphaproteobacteria bacterium]